MTSILLLTIGLLVSGITAPSFRVDSINQQNTEEIRASYPNGDASTYYNGIDSNASSDVLLSSLRSLNSSKRKFTPGYSGLWTYYGLTDYYDTPNSGNYTPFYRGTSALRGSMNKEHVWPDSRGGNYVEADIHMPRPTLTSDNSDRANDFYGDPSTDNTGKVWDPSSCGTESYRGDSARIIFYCVVASSVLSVSDNPNDSTGANTMGKISDLLKWNLEYPVLQREKNRNEGAESVQGNRNPFIDHPEYACKIWGNYNEDTMEVCSISRDPVVESVTMKYNGETVTDTKKFQISKGSVTFTSSVVTQYGATDTVTWSSSNQNVATVNNGIVTFIGVGSTTIKVQSTFDSTKYDTCVLTIADEDIPVSSISINPTSLTLKTYDSSSLVVSVLPEDAKNTNYSLSSSDPLTVSVMDNDTIYAVKPGSAVITATSESGNKTAQCSVTVNEPNATGGYKKITTNAELTSGNYLFVYESTKVALNGYLGSSIDANENYIGVTINDGIIESSDSLVSQSFDINITSKAITNSGGLYLNQSSNSNGMSLASTQSYQQTITFDNNGVLNVISSGGAYLRFNTSYGFRYYKSSTYSNQKAVSLFKFVEGSNEDRENAMAYVNTFMSTLSTECQNLNVQQSTWNSLKTSYGNLSNGSKDYIVDNSTEVAAIIAMIQRYTYIVNKYHYEEFIKDSNGELIVINEYANNNVYQNDLFSPEFFIISLLVLSGITTTSLVVVFNKRNKKKN